MATSIAEKIFTFSVLLAITTALTDDEIAQAACVAIAPSGFVSAIRKPCNRNNPSCNTLCRDAACSMRKIYGNQGSTSGTCFQTFHIYGRRNTLKNSDMGKAHMAIYKIGNGCGNTNCGPNFCCCKA
eukprot:XP_011440842.1 PREDICTED: uncharacterized protein LOC105337683 isoform X3 [Crassostrea gigas]